MVRAEGELAEQFEVRDKSFVQRAVQLADASGAPSCVREREALAAQIACSSAERKRVDGRSLHEKQTEQVRRAYELVVLRVPLDAGGVRLEATTPARTACMAIWAVSVSPPPPMHKPLPTMEYACTAQAVLPRHRRKPIEGPQRVHAY